MSEARPLDSLLHPVTVAVGGATAVPGKLGYELLRNLVDGRTT